MYCCTWGRKILIWVIILLNINIYILMILVSIKISENVLWSITTTSDELFDKTGKQVRSNLNIAKRDDFVWTKVRGRYLQADVNLLLEKSTYSDIS